jgi:hypothetical protein
VRGRGPRAGRRNRQSRLVGFLLALCIACFARPVEAQQNGQKLTTNHYAIDLFTGPVLGSGRIVGMSGAYGAIATGIDGSFINPVGYAERYEQEIDQFEWELTGSVSVGGLLINNDLDNNGQRNDLPTKNSAQLTGGLRLQIGDAGAGATAIWQQYTLVGKDHRQSDFLFANYRVGTGYAFYRGSLVLGGTWRIVSFTLSDPSMKNSSLVKFTGYGAEFGALIRPAFERYRIAAVVRTPVASKPRSESNVTMNDGVTYVRDFVLPEQVHVPWELDVGFAYQLGERRSNIPWQGKRTLARKLKRQISEGTYVAPPSNGGPEFQELPADEKRALEQAVEDQHESERRFVRHQPRRYVLLSCDFLLFGPTTRGQGVAAFLSQKAEASGRRVSVGTRFGAESEILQDRLRARAGTYLEPSRFGRAHYRPHGTLGSDVRLFDAWSWAIRGTLTLDVAPRYFDWGVAIGLWH